MTDNIFRRTPVIAGPCSAESRRQMLDAAAMVSAAGVTVLRAGAWKPRTRPGGFEGYGVRALPWIADAARRHGLLSATEVATPQHVEQALHAGIDMLWIGARTTSDPFAVQALADTLQRLGALHIPILVKNPLSPDVALWSGAIERLERAGVTTLAAVLRGFRQEGSPYRNAPMWSVALELSVRRPDIPVYCDPSHIAGRADRVADVARRALDTGLAGIMVEAHPAPAVAMSDAVQQLDEGQLRSMLAALPPVRHGADTADELTLLRSRIDTLDDELLALLARRMAVSADIGAYKRRHGISPLQPRRFGELLERLIREGAAAGLSPELVRRVMAAVHAESVARQLPE